MFLWDTWAIGTSLYNCLTLRNLLIQPFNPVVEISRYQCRCIYGWIWCKKDICIRCSCTITCCGGMPSKCGWVIHAHSRKTELAHDALTCISNITLLHGTHTHTHRVYMYICSLSLSRCVFSVRLCLCESVMWIKLTPVHSTRKFQRLSALHSNNKKDAYKICVPKILLPVPVNS